MRNVTKDGIGETHNLRTNITLHSLLFLRYLTPKASMQFLRLVSVEVD